MLSGELTTIQFKCAAESSNTFAEVPSRTTCILYERVKAGDHFNLGTGLYKANGRLSIGDELLVSQLAQKPKGAHTAEDSSQC